MIRTSENETIRARDARVGRTMVDRRREWSRRNDTIVGLKTNARPHLADKSPKPDPVWYTILRDFVYGCP